MKCIVGIESTAHTFGIGVLDMSGKILANEKDSYVTSEGGMIPMEVRRHHEKVGEEVWERALKSAGIDESKIKVIAFSNAPGLAPCLLEGMSFAKKKARELDVKLVGVNHCVAHLVVGETVGAKDAVMLYASGANTQVIAYEGGKFRVFGETLDLGVGNFIDTIGRTMGLGFPAGPRIEKLAAEYDGELLELPYAVKGMDVSLSGIQTKIRNFISRIDSKHQTGQVSGKDYGELAFALQETVFAMLVEVAERALAHTGKTELLLGGGVACNSRLVEMCRIMCEERGAKLFVPEKSLLVDNGAMIGYLGLKMYKKGLGVRDLGLVDIRPRERTDEVEVLW
ncbi:tRNA (adenosine(37)-N6)-threonylcarbamoyltransferase complex transferase subunit TsaD [Methanococcoides sp. SA1]|nr:tRNA (adenosine(37)-N6)-threonylcarbamoyltransferase complex transferase subunit TsaD [Methanococcoides sp. SA1]